MNIELAQRISLAFLKANVPLHIWGEAGVGKSTFLEELADKEGYHIVDLRLATQEVGDLIGIPTTQNRKTRRVRGVDEEGNLIVEEEETLVTCWAAPNWLSEIYEKEADGITTLIFADEMDRAPKEVIQAFYQMVTKRQLHEHKLPKQTRLVAAGNPPTEEYMVDSFDHAMITRWGHIVVDCSPDVWLAQFGPRCHDEISGFIAVQPSALHQSSSKWDVGSVQMCTPRGWEMVNRIYEAVGHKDKELLQLCIGAIVGRSAASEFMLMLDKDWVRIEDILSGRADIKTIESASDSNLKYIRIGHEVMQNMTYKQFEHGTKGDKKLIEKRRKNFVQFISDLSHKKKDLVIAACKVLATRDPALMRLMLTQNKEIAEIVGKLSHQVKNLF